MYEKFTERAKKVMSLARQEAQRLDAAEIGTEHILLGIIQEGGGIAAKVLKNMNVDLKRIRLQIDNHPRSTSTKVSLGERPVSIEAREALDLAQESACQLGHDVIGTEHLLLGVLRDKKGPAGTILRDLNLISEEVRDMILEVLGADIGFDDIRYNPEALPDPGEVKNAMGKVRLMTDEVDSRLGKLAQEYGVHGELLNTGKHSFMITRISETWGVFIARNDDAHQHITGCRLDEKLEFLGVAKKLETLYHRRIAHVFSQAQKVIEKNGK